MATNERWTGWMWSERVRKYGSTPPHARFCTTRFAPWWERSSESVPVVGQWRMCVRLSTRETGPDAAPWRRQPAFTSSVSITGIKPA